ncbi:MAG: hypothetical protein Q9227_007999 [Pyrenula ochraceoflavens]
MVGIPGKSGGCHTCRQRKVRCDLQKPECNRCLVRKVKCGGYNVSPIFVNRDPDNINTSCSQLLHKAVTGSSIKSSNRPPRVRVDSHRIVKRDHDPKRSPDSQPKKQTPSSISPENQQPLEDGGQVDNVSPPFLSLPKEGFRRSMSQPILESQSTAKAPSTCEALVAQILPYPVRLNVEQKNLVEDFLFHTLPVHRFFNKASSNWTYILPYVESPSTPNVHDAFMALAAIKVGHVCRNFSLVEAGHAYYAESLASLSGVLSQSPGYNLNIFITMYLLSQYELYECSVDSALKGPWLTHFNGLTKLVEMAGPDRFTEGVEHNIFIDIRLAAINIALCQRKSTFLADPSWVARPFSSKFRVKSGLQQLLDYMAKISCKLEESDRLHTLTAQRDFQYYKLKSLRLECISLIGLLDNWYEEYLDKSHGPLYQPRTSTIDRDSDDESLMFPVQFVFSEPLTALNLLLFWSAQLLLHITVEDLEFDLRLCATSRQSSIETTVTGSPPAPRTRPIEEFKPNCTAHCLYLADCIAQSTEYMTHDDLRTVGPRIAIWPLCWAQQMYDRVEGCDQKSVWCQGIISAINFHGYPFLDHKSDFFDEIVPRRLPIRYQTAVPLQTTLCRLGLDRRHRH